MLSLRRLPEETLRTAAGYKAEQFRDDGRRQAFEVTTP